MAPARPLKRQKTNPDTQPPSTPQPAQVPLPPDTPRSPEPSPAQAQDNQNSSWYKSWPRKTIPVAQVARESISKATDAASETASVLSNKVSERRASVRSPSLAMTLGKTSSNRSLPIDAMTTKVNATPEAASPSRKSSMQPLHSDSISKADPKSSTGKNQKEDSKTANGAIPPKSPVATDAPPVLQPDGLQKKDTDKSIWLGWLSKISEKPDQAPETQDKAANIAASTSSKPDATQGLTIPDPPRLQGITPNPQPDKIDTTPSNKRSWIQMWGGDDAVKNGATPEVTQASGTQSTAQTDKSKSLEISKPQTPSKTASQASSIETSPPPQLPGDGNKSSGWVFWSRERKPMNANTSAEPHHGEIAISDTPSQNRPKRASISLAKDEKPPEAQRVQKDAKNKQPVAVEDTKSVGPLRPETPQSSKKGHVKEGSQVTKAESANATAISREPELRTASPAPSVQNIDNLLLPGFRNTLSLPENPSILQQLARLMYYTKEPEMKHLSLVKDSPRIRNALAIGVHGYFPGPMVRKFLGQPTGTSIKFADMAAKAIRKWTNKRGHDCQVKTAALEGEGKIAERVDLLWKLLLNWIEEIRKSDFVLVACHSQGVPVAIMLVAKLIQFGCIAPARVGVCAMAGVNMGPFVEYKSRWISGSAGELFEFSDPESRVSKDFTAALDTLLRAGSRLTLIGSIDDQLVSLESSIFSPVTHPHIYRAVLIDSHVHAPNFLSHLVGFVLKLRNLGVHDHGLIRELSAPLAGSLYGGEGHSRIYDDDAVYDLAVSFALETTSLANVPLTRRSSSSSGGNPYILPFAMRGILEEDFVKSELQEEAQQLLREFDEWKPTTKVLKDVKFRLEGVRSRL